MICKTCNKPVLEAKGGVFDGKYPLNGHKVISIKDEEYGGFVIVCPSRATAGEWEKKPIKVKL